MASPVDLRIGTAGTWCHRHPDQVSSSVYRNDIESELLLNCWLDGCDKVIAKGVQDLVKLLTGNEGSLALEPRAHAEAALATLETKYGYTKESARDLVGALASMRYRS